MTVRGLLLLAAIDTGLHAAMNNWQSKSAAEAAKLTRVPGDAVAG